MSSNCLKCWINTEIKEEIQKVKTEGLKRKTTEE